ncbi:hypothetical protein [Agrococcus casei]|uniref:hypothetical protein n=1 Tax=Agrococcus casei TaxID=343512 RepID=UPI000B35286C|nr:hypothetical protein [Agrococcus casei]
MGSTEEAAEEFDYAGGAAVLAVREGPLVDLLPAFAENPFDRHVQDLLQSLLKSQQLRRATAFVERYRPVTASNIEVP